MNIRTHPDQFRGVHEPIFKDRFRYMRNALSLCHQRHILRLHIGWEKRMRLGHDILRLQAASGLFNIKRGFVLFIYIDTSGTKLFYDRREMFGAAVAYLQFAFRDGGRDNERSRF